MSEVLLKPLVLIKCNNCKLIQLQYTAPMELMYRGIIGTKVVLQKQ